MNIMCLRSMEGLVDATYIINLDRSTDRMAVMAQQCEALGIPYTRVPAIDGSKIKPHVLEKVTTPFCRRMCTTSMIGCALSHMRTWKTVVREGHHLALIMEDDANIVPEFVAGLRRALADVPRDFDVLLLGCFFMCNKSRSYALGTRLIKPFVHRRHDTRTWGSVYVPEAFAGSHCYVVSQQGARKLLRLIPRVSWHIDIAINVSPTINVYAVSPDLAFQRDMSTSSIASYSFPKTLVPALDTIKDDKGIPLSYYMGTPFGRIGALTIDVWLVLLAVAGLTRHRRAAPYVAGWFLAEIMIGGSVLKPAVAFGVGWAVRAGVARLL